MEIYPDDYSFEDQVQMLSQASVVVSEFGALMANVAFCPVGTTVIEIIPEGQNDPWSAHLFAALRLDHIVLFQEVRDIDREHFPIGGRILKNINFHYKGDVSHIVETVTKIIA